MQRALGELISLLRRRGLAVSTAESIDALRAISELGLSDRAILKEVLCTTLVKSERDQARFEKAFDDYFDAQGKAHGDVFERLRASGFLPAEVAAARDIIEQNRATEQGGQVYRALSQGDASVQQFIQAGARQVGIQRDDDAARTGFLTMRVLDAMRFPRAEARMVMLRMQLREALGERGDALADALSEELLQIRENVRQHVSEQLSASAQPRSLDEVPFHQLSPREVVRVEHEVKLLAERLLGRAAVRARHAKRGRLHVPRTLRAALPTFGVPFKPQFHGKRQRAPKLVVLCDISDSVRESARFMLLFTHVAQRLFETARSFVFVGEVKDATDVFRRERTERAVELAYSGAIVNVADNSHYGRVFQQLVRDHAERFDARTTLVVLGDGRTNHFDPGEQPFAELCARVQRVLWLTPEPESRWSTADSALPVYRRHVDQVLAVSDLASLRRAAREIAAF